MTKRLHELRTPDAVGKGLAIAEQQALELMHHDKRNKATGLKLATERSG